MANVGFGLHFGRAWLRLVEKVLWQDTIQFCVHLCRQVLRLTFQRLIVRLIVNMRVGQFMRELEARLDLTPKQHEVAVDSFWRMPRTKMWLCNQRWRGDSGGRRVGQNLIARAMISTGIAKQKYDTFEHKRGCRRVFVCV